MKILLVSKGDNGGAQYWLSQVINEHTDHEARAVRGIQSYIDYPYDLLNPPEDELRGLCQWADIIHARDNYSILPKGCKKPLVMTYTGMSYRRHCEKLIDRCRSRGQLVTVSTIDLTLYHGEHQAPPLWLPNPREDMRSRAKKHDQFTVAHAPTYRDRKGTETVIKALAKIDNANLELIEGLTYAQCVKRKRRCHALVDQFAWGYGNNAIEAWAMGQPVIGGVMAEKYADVVLRLAGYLPYIPAEEDVKSIGVAVQQAIDNPQWAIERGREYFHTFHHAPAVAMRAIEIYEAALSR